MIGRYPQVTFQVIAKICCVVIGSALGVSCGGSRTVPYDLDMVNPERLVHDSTYSVTASQVNVYLTGPRQSFDSHIGVSELFAMQPLFTATDVSEARMIIADLSKVSSIEGGSTSAASGYTCHILLVDPNEKSVMHFRIFLPLDGLGTRVDVYPRSHAGFGYSNAALVPWLRRVVAPHVPAWKSDFRGRQSSRSDTSTIRLR